MTTFADKAILSGADNHLPMLEKDMYDSWKSIMELYIMNRQHGRLILESVENGPLFWPMIEENAVTRPRKYSELSPTDAIQADCDVKANNIILQGLPPECGLGGGGEVRLRFDWLWCLTVESNAEERSGVEENGGSGGLPEVVVAVV
nr:hypothetical protein [Tanacetum cinerariifolium]